MGKIPAPQTKFLGIKLSALRKSADLSQLEMAELLEVNPREISRYEASHYEPPGIILMKYARWSRVSLEMLLDDELELPKRLRGWM